MSIHESEAKFFSRGSGSREYLAYRALQALYDPLENALLTTNKKWDTAMSLPKEISIKPLMPSKLIRISNMQRAVSRVTEVDLTTVHKLYTWAL